LVQDVVRHVFIELSLSFLILSYLRGGSFGVFSLVLGAGFSCSRPVSLNVLYAWFRRVFPCSPF